MLRTLLLASIAAFVASPVLAQDAATIDHGKEVFAAQKCSLCHSVEGKGNKNGPLEGVGSRLSEDEIRQWITSPKEMTPRVERKPPMKEYKDLSDEDLAAIVTYMFSLKEQT